MPRRGWWAQSRGGRLLPGAKHPRGLSSPQWTCLPSCMDCPASGRGGGNAIYLFICCCCFVFFKGGQPVIVKMREGQLERRWREDGEMHTDGCWQFSPPSKGHVVLLGTVLVSHPSIVPWPRGYHPFQVAFTPTLSFSADLWPPTAYYAVFV